MPIDTRATTAVTIAGTSYSLIDASLTDESIQGSGLVRCRGNCTIAGLLTPDVGAVVRFTYTTATGVTRAIPRTLRVLSSFANVQTRRTQIELGDLLIYLDNRKPGISKVNTREENGAVPCYVFDTATLAISASYVLDFCLDQLGLTAASNPLTSKFSDDTYDVSGGYVATIGELLLSESFCGYLDASEVLQVRDLSANLSTGPLLTSTDLLAINQIGTGTLPGEAVVVRYDTKRMVSDPTTRIRDWEEEQTIGDVVTISDPVELPDGSTVVNYYFYQEATVTTTQYDVWDRAIYRLQSVNGYPLQQWTQTWWTYASNAPVPGDGTEDASECIYVKPTISTEVVQEFTEVTGPLSDIVRACNFERSIYPSLASIPRTRVVLERRVTTYEKDPVSGITRTLVRRFVPYVNTPGGADAIRAMAQRVTEPPDGLFTKDFVIRNASALVPFGGSVQIRTERNFGLQERPSQSVRNAGALRVGDKTRQEAQLEWIYGAANSAAVTDFDLPKAPDDWYSWTLGGGYVKNDSGAQAVARKFGRIQNAMLLGNRQGMAIQCSPLKLPPNPFDPIYITAAGITAQYRVNGLSWTINATDVIASTDAMLWGAVGAAAGTDLAGSWVPLAPSMTSLPAPPSGTSDGTYGTVLTPTVVVPPYNETVRSELRIRVALRRRDVAYPIYLFAEPALLTVEAGDAAFPIRPVLAASPAVVTMQAMAADMVAGVYMQGVTAEVSVEAVDAEMSGESAFPVTVTVGGTDYTITTISGAWSTVQTDLEAQEWWGDSALARDLAEAVDALEVGRDVNAFLDLYGTTGFTDYGTPEASPPELGPLFAFQRGTMGSDPATNFRAFDGGSSESPGEYGEKNVADADSAVWAVIAT